MDPAVELEPERDRRCLLGHIEHLAPELGGLLRERLELVLDLLDDMRRRVVEDEPRLDLRRHDRSSSARPAAFSASTMAPIDRYSSSSSSTGTFSQPRS